MNGFIGLNDVLKNINLIWERRQLIRDWYAKLAVRSLATDDSEDNN